MIGIIKLGTDDITLIPPPLFLDDFGDRSKSGIKGKYQISRYHVNSPPPFISKKSALGGGGIKGKSSVPPALLIFLALDKGVEVFKASEQKSSVV